MKGILRSRPRPTTTARSPARKVARFRQGALCAPDRPPLLHRLQPCQQNVRLPSVEAQYPLWSFLGLNVMDTVCTPDEQEELVGTPGNGGTLLADWAEVRRAVRYFVWIKVLAVNADTARCGRRDGLHTTHLSLTQLRKALSGGSL